jgi:hypothetical protein
MRAWGFVGFVGSGGGVWMKNPRDFVSRGLRRGWALLPVIFAERTERFGSRFQSRTLARTSRRREPDPFKRTDHGTYLRNHFPGHKLQLLFGWAPATTRILRIPRLRHTPQQCFSGCVQIAADRRRGSDCQNSSRKLGSRRSISVIRRRAPIRQGRVVPTAGWDPASRGGTARPRPTGTRAMPGSPRIIEGWLFRLREGVEQ